MPKTTGDDQTALLVKEITIPFKDRFELYFDMEKPWGVELQGSGITLSYYPSPDGIQSQFQFLWIRANQEIEWRWIGASPLFIGTINKQNSLYYLFVIDWTEQTPTEDEVLKVSEI